MAPPFRHETGPGQRAPGDCRHGGKSIRMIRIVDTGETFEVQDRMTAGRRVVLLLLAMFPLIAPYELLLEPRWQGYLNLVFLFAVLISAGAMAVSGFFVWAAIAGLNRQTSFHLGDGTFTHTADAPIVPRRPYRAPIGSIRGVHLQTHEWSDGPDTYSLVLELDGRHKLSAASSLSSEEIARIKERIERFLDLPHQ